MAEYQGWKNWQTWNVALYLNNEEPLYRAMQRCAREKRRTAERDGGRRTVNAQEAEIFVRGHMASGTADMKDTDNPTGRRGARAMDGTHWPSIARVISESIDP